MLVLSEPKDLNTVNPPTLNWAAKLQQVTPRSWASFSTRRGVNVHRIPESEVSVGAAGHKHLATGREAAGHNTGLAHCTASVKRR